MRIALVLQIFRNKQTNFRNDSDFRSPEKMCELEEGTYLQCLHTLLSNNLNIWIGVHDAHFQFSFLPRCM